MFVKVCICFLEVAPFSIYYLWLISRKIFTWSETIPNLFNICSIKSVWSALEKCVTESIPLIQWWQSPVLITLQISFDITNEASLHIITLASAPQTTISIFVKSQLDFFVAGIASFSCFWCQVAIGPGITQFLGSDLINEEWICWIPLCGKKNIDISHTKSWLRSIFQNYSSFFFF